MTEFQSKDTIMNTLHVTNKLVSEHAIRLIGELKRLHAKQRIKADPKSYEGLPHTEEILDDSITSEWTDEEWNNFMEKREEIQSKEYDIYLANGGFTNPEAHIYFERYIKNFQK